MERFLEAAVSPAPGDMADCYAERFVVEMPFAGGLAPERTEMTREEFRARVTAGLGGAPGTPGRWTCASTRRPTPRSVVAEYRLEGHKGADASPFSLAFVMVVTVRDGLIVHSRDYSNPIDGARLLGRIPQLVAMPTDEGPKDRGYLAPDSNGKYSTTDGSQPRRPCLRALARALGRTADPEGAGGRPVPPG